MLTHGANHSQHLLLCCRTARDPTVSLLLTCAYFVSSIIGIVRCLLPILLLTLLLLETKLLRVKPVILMLNSPKSGTSLLPKVSVMLIVGFHHLLVLRTPGGMVILLEELPHPMLLSSDLHNLIPSLISTDILIPPLLSPLLPKFSTLNLG